jgi:hypothetical protein
MAVKLLFNRIPAFLDGNGNPLTGGLLFTYQAGSTTKRTTYQDSEGLIAHANPIVLNSRGETPAALWGTAGLTYKLVLAPSTDSDPPSSAIWTIDNVSGINDTTASIDQWISGPTPTYVSITQFTLAGDQTTVFHVGRRLKSTITAGTGYHAITASSFGAGVTTVTTNGTSLDSGLSAVSYGLLSLTNPSIPTPTYEYILLTSVAGTNTITGTASRLPVGYASGQLYLLIPAVTNTGATTLNVSGLGAKNVFINGAACAGGELVAGVPLLVEYDGTQFNAIGWTQPTLVNSLSGNVALSDVALYFTGPTCAQGTVGKWWADGTVTMHDTAGASRFDVKLWDGTTVIASCAIQATGGTTPVCASLSGPITTPAGNIRISVKGTGSTSGIILFNATGNSKDSTLTVKRIG